MKKGGLRRLVRLGAGLLGLLATSPALPQEQPDQGKAPVELPLLVTYGAKAATVEGDHDFAQTIYFSVPATHQGKLYLRVFDPD
ncbi:MAG: hypothetical protein ACTSUY_04820, partial [Alphaproteobacteria bacterium]